MKNKNPLQYPCSNLVVFWIARFLFCRPKAAAHEEAQAILPFLSPVVEKMNEVEEMDIFLSPKNNIVKEEVVLRVLKSQMPRLRNSAWKIDEGFKEKLFEIGHLFKLNKVERTLLVFSVIWKTCEPFRELIDSQSFSSIELIRILSFMLKVDEKDVRRFLSGKCRLSKLGLISVDTPNYQSVVSLDIELLEGLETHFFFDVDKKEIFQGSLKRVAPSELEEKYFSHVKERDILINFLKGSLEKKEIGSNVLIYGRPGSGKTELVKGLERQGLEIYAISLRGRDGTSLSDAMRIAKYRIAQFMLKSNNRAVILLDDADSLLVDRSGVLSFFGVEQEAEFSKAQMVSLLEKNRVPTIWICNTIETIHDALKRRFGLAIFLGKLPRKRRLQIIRHHFKESGIGKNLMEGLADLNIEPGVLERCARTLKLLSDSNEPNIENDLVATTILNSSLRLMGLRPAKTTENALRMPFLLEALNTDYQLSEIINIFKHRHEGRLLLTGSPGTGKTEFVRYMAKHLDKELILKRASDLLSPFVGETEIKISDLFLNLSTEESIIFLDEADTFFFSREMAQRSWEVSQVNEILSQMEDFRGIFICATNHISHLDNAALRRFDLKITFRPMLFEQAWMLFKALFGKNAKQKHKTALETLCLTPGNFGTVYRRLKLFESICPFTPDIFLTELLKELESTNQ